MNEVNFKQEDLNKVVTLGVLLEYTDEFLLPKIEDLFEENNKSMFKEISNQFEENNKKLSGQLTYELKTYIDEKLNKQTEEIFTRLEKRFDRNRQFKERLIGILRAHRIGSTDDWLALEQLLTLQR